MPRLATCSKETTLQSSMIQVRLFNLIYNFLNQNGQQETADFFAKKCPIIIPNSKPSDEDTLMEIYRSWKTRTDGKKSSECENCARKRKNQIQLNTAEDQSAKTCAETSNINKRRKKYGNKRMPQEESKVADKDENRSMTNIAGEKESWRLVNVGQKNGGCDNKSKNGSGYSKKEQNTPSQRLDENEGLAEADRKQANEPNVDNSPSDDLVEADKNSNGKKNIESTLSDYSDLDPADESSESDGDAALVDNSYIDDEQEEKDSGEDDEVEGARFGIACFDTCFKRIPYRSEEDCIPKPTDIDTVPAASENGKLRPLTKQEKKFRRWMLENYRNGKHKDFIYKKVSIEGTEDPAFVVKGRLHCALFNGYVLSCLFCRHIFYSQYLMSIAETDGRICPRCERKDLPLRRRVQAITNYGLGC